MTIYGELPEALVKCRLFKGIPEDELKLMLECMKPKVCSYSRNEAACIEGEAFTGIGLVLSGEAAVSKENSAGSRMIVAMLGPGDMFGEMAAFSGSDAWPATVFAQGALTVMYLPPKTIIGECSKLCPSHRKLILNMLEVVSKKALMLNRKLEYLAVKSLRGRIANYLLEQYKVSGTKLFTVSMKRNELADFLNVSRPSLSRELCRMRDEGLISFQRSSIKITELEALKAQAI